MIRSNQLFYCITVVLIVSMLSCRDKLPDNHANIEVERGIQKSDTVRICLVGDIMMGTTYPKTMLPTDDGKYIFSDVSDIIKRSNVACGNLEGALLYGGKSRKEGLKNCFSFRMPPRYAEYLKKAGFTFLSLANNHSFDFGQKGIDSTQVYLNDVGIMASYLKPDTLSIDGTKYGFCAFGFSRHSICMWDEERVKQIVEDLSKQVDITIVSFHAGAEGLKYQHLPHATEYFMGECRGNSRHFAKLCVDAGADVVYGHGPHVLRAVEVYRGKFIAYSLGNFCTPCGMSLDKEMCLAPLLELQTDGKGNFIYGKIHSFIQQHTIGPRKDNEHLAAKKIKLLTKADCPTTLLSISETGHITLTNN